jgi:hypothetical protein
MVIIKIKKSSNSEQRTIEYPNLFTRIVKRTTQQQQTTTTTTTTQEFSWFIAAGLLVSACDSDYLKCPDEADNTYKLTLAGTILSLAAVILLFCGHYCNVAPSTLYNITNVCAVVWFITIVLGIAAASLATDFALGDLTLSDQDTENKYKAGYWFIWATQIFPRGLALFLAVDPCGLFSGRSSSTSKSYQENLA